MAYSNDTLEEGLKNKVARNYFPSYDCTEIKGKIDFCVRLEAPAGQSEFFDQSLYWAEAKKGEANPYESIVQLILTIGKARAYNEYLPPPFLGAFDARLIAFLPYTAIQDVFNRNDFNWNVKPSNHETREFKELYALVKDTLKAKSLVFYYDRDDYALRKFIKENLREGQAGVHGIQIDKNNFLAVYLRWLEEVKPSIAAAWEGAKRHGIIDADFYLADLLSSDNMTLKDKLFVVLKHNVYEFNKKIDDDGFFTYSNAQFKDGQAAHKAFWAKYERPPREEYWDYIIERRDLLVPQDIRERKGSFFTPKQWVTLSQQYIARALGENWQEEYTVWDCCAGTGNLLAGLTEKYNIYASTIDKQDVDVMHDRIANGAGLLDAHVFQFDFLNDGLTSAKVPQSLREILADPDKRKKLVIYMNPPYAEVSSKRVSSDGTKGKAGVNQTMIHKKYDNQLGTAGRELFTQFLIRIQNELQGCIIANFSTLKLLQGSAFKAMRGYFTAKLTTLFLMPANTFDNVGGEFPIGFHIWDTAVKEPFKEITADVYDKDVKPLEGKLLSLDDNYINKWISLYKTKAKDTVGFMDGINGNDFQHNSIVYIANDNSAIPNPRGIWITANNLIPCCIYFSVRHVIPHTWLNHNDQFLYPNDRWKADKDFQNNCLVYTLFHGKNCISARTANHLPLTTNHYINHWLPFTEQEVDAGERFESHFMTDFMAGKIVTVDSGEGQGELSPSPTAAEPLAFSETARAVLDAGREVWRYYHSVIRDCFMGSQARGNRNDGGGYAGGLNRGDGWGAGALTTNHSTLITSFGVNASLYDIRASFQGRDDKGRMNSTSNDAKYTALMARLRGALDALAKRIEGKVYEYGFLKG